MSDIKVENKSTLERVSQAIDTIKDIQVRQGASEDTIGNLRKELMGLKENIISKQKEYPDATLENSRGTFRDRNEVECMKKLMVAMSKKRPSADDSKIIKAFNEGTAAAGGYTVPTVQANTIARVQNKYGFLRQYANVIQVPTDDYRLPTFINELPVYWINEGSSITSPTFDYFGEVTMTPKKLAVTIPMTYELTEDSTISLVTLFTEQVGISLSKEEDRVGLAGDVDVNGDPFDGVLYSDNVNILTMGSGDTSFDDISANDLLDMQAYVDKGISDNTRYVADLSIWHTIQKTQASTGQYTIQNPADPKIMQLWSKPFHDTTVMPSIAEASSDSTIAALPFLIYGNFKFLYLAERGQPLIEQDKNISTEIVTWKFRKRLAIAIALGTKSFCVLKPSAT